MTIADRIAIVADGRTIEEGSPRDIYECPNRRFAAEFIGENNVLDGRVLSQNGRYLQIDVNGTSIDITAPAELVSPSSEVAISIRSELMRLALRESAIGHSMQGTMATYLEGVYLGITTMHLVRLPDGKEIAVRSLSDGSGDGRLEPGQEVRITWDTDKARLHLG